MPGVPRGYITPISATVFMWPSLLLSVSLIRTFVIGFKTRIIQDDLIWVSLT